MPLDRLENAGDSCDDPGRLLTFSGRPGWDRIFACQSNPFFVIGLGCQAGAEFLCHDENGDP